MADEIWLDVLPSLKRLAPSLKRGADAAARAAGKSAGKNFGDAFEDGAGNAAQEQVKKLESAQKSAAGLVSKLSGEVSKARQAQQRSAAELLLAEQRLADATAKYGEDSNQAQAAALKLDAARGKAADTTKRFENTEDALREAHKANTAATEQLEKAQADLNRTTDKSPGLWAKLKRSISDTDASADRTTRTLDRLKNGAKLVGKGLVIGTSAVAGFAAVLGGMAIKGGIDRALNIEDARASLTGLGHDTKAIDKIMQSALASVKGTAYGLGDAATIAATAVAAGIKPGTDLTKTLKLTANTAALARTDLTEMGAILNQVWTQGKVDTEGLNQLAERGIPIWTKLAEHYKVSGSDFRKMVSDGKVDAETFAAVLTDTVGTAADEMGKTTRGMWQNFKAALGRGGEVVMKPFLDAFKGGLGEITPLIDNAVAGLKPLMEEFGRNLPGYIQAAKDAFADAADVMNNRIIPAISAVVGWVKENEAWLKPLTVAILAGAVAWKIYDLAVGGYAKIAGFVTKLLQGQTVAQWALNAAMSANPIGLIVGLVVGLVAAFVYLWNTNEGFRNFFINAWENIKGAVKTAGDFIGGVFSTISGWVTGTLGPVFTNFYNGVILPVWSGISSAIDTASSVVMGVLGSVWSFLKNTFGPVFTWLYNSIIKPVWGLIKWQIDLVSNIVLFLFDLTVYTIRNVLAPAFRWLYENVIKPVWNSIKTAINVAWIVIKAIFAATVSTVRNTFGAAFTWLYEKIIKPVWSGIKFVISLWWSGVKIIFFAVRDFLKDTLGPVFTWLRDKVIKPVWNGIKSTISTVWNKGIKPIFTALGDFIEDKVVPAFKRGVKGIGDAWEVVKKAAGTPVYFVMETIYNKGIKAAFDNVSRAIGSKARLPEAKTKGIPHFAKGGQMQDGWKLVGEEGPELINTGPGFVYTARQTKAMLAGKQQAPIGVLDSLRDQGVGEAEHAGIGGWTDTVFGGIKSAAGWVGDKLKKGLDWVRGGLAKAAGALLNPVRNLVTDNVDGGNFFGGIVRKVATNAIDGVLKWISGKDEEFPADEYGGGFTGSNGGFYRPVGGTITSLFGSSRGRYPHAGTDLAVPIGTAVRAAWNGVVAKAGWNVVGGRSGIGMLLRHAGGQATYYGHLSKAIAKVGQEVKAGQIIAKSGNTGRSTGPHLHFETWRGNTPYNNINLLRRGGGSGRKAALYDQGGILPPGLTLTNNQSGKPETVYTHAQSQALQTLAIRGAEASFPETVILKVDGYEFTAYVSTVADGRMRKAKQEARRGNRQMTGQR